MITQIVVALIVAVILFEIIEHVVFPLVWLILDRKRRLVSGAEGMVGKVVEVKQWNKAEGRVLVNAEMWRAVSDVPLLKGDKAVIHDVEGLTLRVGPFKD
jgi:membrane-bound ClpP family serine protease